MLGGVPLDIGDVLSRKYRIDGIIGEGGAGLVVQATHLTLEQKVAIKFLRTALATDELRVRFEREARLIGQIESDHVVVLYDAGALPDGSPYMVMEYLKGKDLSKVLSEDGPLSIEDAVDCILQVCEALGQAHAAGIIHRDLKPANLFLTRREDGGPHVKVVDFGISKMRGDIDKREVTAEFTVLGSPRYMAPEQLRNTKDVDHRADLWSLGAVLFQLVTGEHAFEGNSNIQASLEVITKEPKTLKHAGLDAVVKKCLTKDPAKRFQSADEIAAALRPFASDVTKEMIDDSDRARHEPSIQIAMAVESSDALQSSRPAPIAQPVTEPMAFRPQPKVVTATVTKPSGWPKLAFVAAGVALVVVAFFLFSGLKVIARRVGFYTEPSTTQAATRAAPAPERPSEAIIVPLADAGH